MSRRAKPKKTTPAAPPPADRVRLDLWLWRARFYKTRGLAADAAAAGRIRVNSVRTDKPGHGLKIGDTLTFTRGGRAVVVALRDFGARRGPAAEARLLYEDLSDPPGPARIDPLDASDDLA